MRILILILMLAIGSASYAQNTNPTVDIQLPFEGSTYFGVIVAKVDNFRYQPDEATNPATEFNNGKQSYGEGHAHGWLFKSDWLGRKKRMDLDSLPLPSSYLEFFGAGNAVWIPTGLDSGYYVLMPKLKRGRYKFFVQLQHDDHTGALQQTAPAFPAIDSVSFRVR